MIDPSAVNPPERNETVLNSGVPKAVTLFVFFGIHTVHLTPNFSNSFRWVEIVDVAGNFGTS